MTLTGLIGVENRPPSAPVAPWTPADLGAALRLWIKADTGVTATGGLIDQINDQSGANFHLYSHTTFRPTLNATGYNSLPSIDFNAANSTYLTTQAGGYPIDPTILLPLAMGSSSSWFFIGQMDTGTAAYGRALSYIGSTGTAADYGHAGSVAAMLRNGATNALCMYQAALATGASGSVSLNTNVRVLMVFDNTNATLYINNIQVAQQAVSFTLNSSGVVTVGNNAEVSGTAIGIFTNAPFDGTMAEILVTNTALNSTERSNLDAYVVARLGA